MISRMLVAGVIVLVVLGLFAATYFIGHRSGAEQERAVWVERERVREDAVAVAQRNQAEAMQRLNDEIKTLQERPERVRTVTKKIVVTADKECASLPSDFRALWNAE